MMGLPEKEATVMANTFAPNGFQQYSGTGSAPTYEQVVMSIAYNNTTPIFSGDPVAQINTGYIGQAPVSTGTSSQPSITGVFVGCKYLSVAQKRTVWSNYWPGSDAASTTSVTAYVVTDPNAQFIVQTGNSNTTAAAAALSIVGQNIGFAWNDSASTGETNGNTTTGQSTYFADLYRVGTDSTLPFRVIGLANYSPELQNSPLSGINGNDASSAYNKIIVTFNNGSTKALTGV
jgi:hypothetical protein